MRTLLAIAALAASATAQCDLTTLFAANNGGSVGGAVYFDITVHQGTRITGFDVNTSVTAGNPIGLTVYTIPGTYVGNSGNMGAWTQVGVDDGNAVAAAANTPSTINLATPFVLTPGTYGVTLVGSGVGGSFNHRYSNGGASNQFYSNSFYDLTLGGASNTPFAASLFSPRIWNGTVHCSGATGIFCAFTADVTSGPEPLTVNFTDLTYSSDPGGVREWDWDLDGDGHTDSTDQNPTYTYGTCGAYDVTLTVHDMVNGGDTCTQVGYILVGDIPVADFDVSTNGGAAPLTVTFTDTSTGNPTSWAWDFEGLGYVSHDQNPTYTFDPLMGTCFDVTLTVSNACGTSTITKTQVVCMVVNDECGDAIALVDGANGPYTNKGATTSSAWPCASGGSDVWFVYTATCDGNVAIDLCGSDYDTAIEVFDGNNGCGGASLGCNDDFCSLQSGLTVPCVTGDVFYVRAGGFNAAQGTILINVTCSPALNNDECSSALTIVDGVNGPYDNLTATTSAPAWGCASGGNDVWFEYTATCAGNVTFDLCSGNTTFDTGMEVFDGNTGCGGAVLDCNDDSCSLQSAVTVAANVGDVFHVRVGGYNGAQGSFELTVTCGTAFFDYHAGAIRPASPGCGKLFQATTGEPRLGQSVSYSLEGAQGFNVMWFGLSKLDIPVCGGCSLGTEIGIAPLTTIYIPNDSLFIGASYFTQGMAVGGTDGCDGFNPFGIPVALSETMVTTIGM